MLPTVSWMSRAMMPLVSVTIASASEMPGVSTPPTVVYAPNFRTSLRLRGLAIRASLGSTDQLDNKPFIGVPGSRPVGTNPEPCHRSARGAAPLTSHHPVPSHRSARGAAPLTSHPPVPSHRSARGAAPLTSHPPVPSHRSARGAAPLTSHHL